MHEGHRGRMREKYIKNGIDSLAEHEVLEMLLYYSVLRGNTNETAHLLLKEFGCIANVFDADVEDLMHVKGVGEQSAVLIKMIKDMASYYNRSVWSERPTLSNSVDTGLYLVDMIGSPSDECFYLLSLNAARKVLSFNLIERGTVNSSSVSVRKVVEHAVKNRASSVVFAHNHPSGRLVPSENDIELTKLLERAFEPIGIAALDHFIVGGGGYLSMSEAGYF